MKILRITTEVNRSSIGRTAEQLGKLVVEEGWESYIAYGRKDGDSISHKIRVGSRISVYFHVLLTRLFDMHGYGSYFATKKLVRIINRIQPNIIHLHDIHGYYINIDVLFSYLKKTNIPIVWTHHDCWAYTGHCGFYSEASCEKWKDHCYNCPNTNNYPKSYFDGSRRNFKKKESLFTSLDNIYNVGVSQWICNELQQSFLRKYPIKCIYNGIDTNIFVPSIQYSDEIRKKFELGNGILLTAVATEWSERKGLSDYFSLRKILDSEFTIVFVGAPQSLIDHLPVGIKGISRTDNMQELVKLYSASSIVMNLAGAESFGKTTPEGLACGVPSIVYNCTASPELIDETTGVVVEKGDIEGVKNAIYKIMSWDRDITIQNCRKRACELFSIEKNWPLYINLYKQILKQ